MHTVSRVLCELCSIWLLSVYHFILCLSSGLTGGQGVGRILVELCSPITQSTTVKDTIMRTFSVYFLV